MIRPFTILVAFDLPLLSAEDELTSGELLAVSAAVADGAVDAETSLTFPLLVEVAGLCDASRSLSTSMGSIGVMTSGIDVCQSDGMFDARCQADASTC